MHTDIVDLRQFYHSELGRMAEQSVSAALASIWARLPEERLLGLGYAVPYLERFRADTERTFAFMKRSKPGTEPMGSPAFAISRSTCCCPISGCRSCSDPGSLNLKRWRIFSRGCIHDRSYLV